MKFNFKKISAVLTSGLMVVSGAAMAAAANFPAPFSDSTAANTAIVYGANAASTDVAAVTNINEYLKTKVTTEGGAPTGESFKIEKPSTKINVGTGIKDVWGSAITKTDLPTLLADGVYRNAKNDEYKYTQQLVLGNISFSHFRDPDFNNNVPTLGFKVNANAAVVNYTLTFNTMPEATQGTDLTDFENRNIQILGKTYYILDYKNSTAKMTLLDSATSDQLGEGETKTLVIGGKSYDVTLDFISTDQVKFRVKKPDGTEVVTELMTSTANTYNLGDGTYIGVRDILVQNYQGGSKMVSFSLGKGKLEVTDASNVKINDKIISDLTGYFTFSRTASKVSWQKLIIEWKLGDKKFLNPGSELVMPGFEAVKFSMSDTTMPDKEMTKVDLAADYASLRTTLKEGDYSIPFLYISQTTGNITGIGKSATELLATSNETTLTYYDLKASDNYHSGFVASWASTRDSESYYLRFKNINEDVGRNETNLVTAAPIGGESTVRCEALYAGQSCNIGSITITVSSVGYNSTDRWVTATINSGGSFNTLYTKDGLKVYLPYSTADGQYASFNTSKGQIYLSSTNASYISDGHHVGGFLLWMGEADQYGSLDNKPFNMTVDGSGGSSPSKRVTVSAVDARGATFQETGTGTKVWEAYMITPLASKITWDKTDSNAYYANVEYHKGEVYANVFVTAPTSTMGEVGNMIFTDAEKASWQGRNVILVGGSCINSATADVLGSAYCESEFTTSTGVGAGQFLIASYADKFTAGKTALVVAGYNAADTTAAASYLLEKTVDTAAGKKYVGTVSATGTVDVTAA
ncbi:Uncharacterised protein [uncultured archaeon]|nr:Uncharacterised protein [uncultured archaeon]